MSPKLCQEALPGAAPRKHSARSHSFKVHPCLFVTGSRIRCPEDLVKADTWGVASYRREFRRKLRRTVTSHPATRLIYPRGRVLVPHAVSS